MLDHDRPLLAELDAPAPIVELDPQAPRAPKTQTPALDTDLEAGLGLGAHESVELQPELSLVEGVVEVAPV